MAARRQRARTAADVYRELEQTFDDLESGELAIVPEDIWIAPRAEPRHPEATRKFWSRYEKRSQGLKR